MSIETKIGKIEGLSSEAGLERVLGQWDVYKRSLKLTIKEISKCDENLNAFLAAGNMRNFSVEVHGMKGLLANIGAFGLSALALELETAADRKDAVFCASALPPFLKELRSFGEKLAELFSEENQNNSPIEIPPELPLIFDKLKTAFIKADFLVIDEEMQGLDLIDSGDALKEEIEGIKEAVMLMDYETAMDIMRKLLK